MKYHNYFVAWADYKNVSDWKLIIYNINKSVHNI